MISRFTKKMKIKNDVYAIYNNIVMLPIFVDKNKCDSILSENLSGFSVEERLELVKAGIVVEDKNTDRKFLDLLKKAYEKTMKERITIMYIIPTNSCNLKCSYCFIGKLNDAQINLSESDALNAVKKFNEHLNKIGEKGTIFFYGAEPLLNFELIKKVVNYTKSKNYNIDYAMVSNGVLLTDEIAQFIKDNDISLGISIDGPKEITDKNRIFKGSNKSVYDTVLTKIKMLQSKKVGFGLSITIAPIFLENEKYFLDWILKLGVLDISYNLLHFTYKTDQWENYYKKATKFIYKSNNMLFDKGFNEDRINRKYESFYNRNFKFTDCAAIGGNQITICPNGDIEICHGYWNRTKKKIPNINSIDSLDEIFETEEYKKWASNLTINKRKCLNCPAIYICGGGCAMQAKDLFDDELAIDKPFCIYTKGMLKNILKEVYEETLEKEQINN